MGALPRLRPNSPTMYLGGEGRSDMAASSAPHISVCIPTYKRPSMLATCLDALMIQRAEGFTYSVIVVDNDPGQSASGIVRERTGSAGRH